MAKQIIYIPWTTDESAHFVEKSMKWQKVGLEDKGKMFGIVAYTGGTQHAFQTLDNGVIYIQGHGSPGSSSISSGGTGARLSASEVASRLQRTGLQTGYKGSIKCWSCHSGEGGGSSFAQNLVDALYDLGFRSCYVYGYEGALDGFYANKGSDGQFHRFSDDPIYDQGKITGWKARGRARFNRHLVTPSQLKGRWVVGKIKK